MKLMFSIALFLLLSCCTIKASDIKIESTPPPSVDGIIQTEAQQTVSLVCTLQSGIHDNKELVWLRNGAMVNLMDGNKENRSHVCISPVIYNDEGATFTCHLKSNASNKASVTLNVTYHPDLSGSEKMTLEEEESLVLSCNMRANPVVTSVIWKLNGSIVDLTTGGFVVTSDGIYSKLRVNKVERSLHEGLYQCTATSPIYGERSKTIQVTVTEKTMKFPLMPMIAGLVVVFLTAILAIVSRWSKIRQCCK
ncbi:transmembrane and immunoglobulin domain-containing protein 1 [Anableps anableps]